MAGGKTGEELAAASRLFRVNVVAAAQAKRDALQGLSAEPSH